MKKTVTILAILAIVLGFAFAETINISFEVTPIRPSFGIVATTITSGGGDISGSSASASSAGTITIVTDYLVANDVSIRITINQVTKSRYIGCYALKLKATDLVLKANDTEVLASPDADEKFTVSKTTDFTATGAIEGSRTVTANSGTETFAGTDGGFEVEYINGKLINVSANQGANMPLGTVEYTWAANPEAVLGNYAATVTLTVITLW